MKHIKALVLDEADALLGSDFRDQIKSILMKLEEDAQICIYSATIDNETLELAENFIEDPLIVTMNEDKLNLDLIQQFKIEMNCDDDKLPTLFDLYGQLTITQAVIFANSINRAKVIYDAMREEGFEVGLIHGHMSSEERVNTLASFRRAEFRVLLATDVIARGIDVQQIGLVFNYDLPKERKTYLHRIGRSGRFKKKGIAINFVVRYNDRRGRDRRNRRNNISDYEKLDNITSHYKNTIHHMPRPDKINEILMGTEVDITRNK
jgi:ATP-dependent RNA helicase